MESNRYLHKFWVGVTALLISGSAVCSADTVEKISDRPVHSDYHHDLGSCDYYDRGYRFDNDNDCCYGDNYNNNCCENFHFCADLIYWRACDPNIFLGTFETTTVDGAVTTTEREVRELHYNWNTGYRIAAGYRFDDCCFLLDATYTHLSSTGRGDFDEAVIVTDITFTSPIAATVFTAPFDAEASWKTRLDLLDIALHREILWCDCLIFTPHVGLRAAWVKQSYHQETSGLIDGDSVIDFADLTSNYSGAGVRVGFDAEYNLCGGFSIYGSSALSLIAGDYTNESLVSSVNFTDDLTTNFEFRDDFCACSAIADLAVGVRWKKEVECGCTCGDVVLSLGWEQHKFFNHGRLQGVVEGFERLRHDDLCFEGITFSVCFDF